MDAARRCAGRFDERRRFGGAFGRRFTRSAATFRSQRRSICAMLSPLRYRIDEQGARHAIDSEPDSVAHRARRATDRLQGRRNSLVASL